MLELLQSLKFNLLHAGFAQLDHHWNYDNVISPFTRLFYVTEGHAKMYHSDQEFDLQKGFMYLVPSYVYNRYKCDVFHEQYYISFFDEIKTGFSIYNLREFTYEAKVTEHDAYLFKRLAELYPKRSIQNSDPKAYVHEPAVLLDFNKRSARTKTDRFMETQGILSLLLSKFVKNTSPEKTNLDNYGNLNTILLFIAENLQSTLTVKELAERSHLSTDHFSRTFKKQMGMGPNLYIQSKRIQRAQLLLLTTNDSLEQIAHKVGMDNFSYFSRTFKKLLGKTPGSFRKEQFRF